jgi:hypothetical protein
MYDYKKTTSLIRVDIPNVDIILDNLPIKHPFIPRICDKQALFLIWWGTKETDADIYEQTLKNKNEEQWVTCTNEWKLEKGVAMLHIYENEIIIGSIKYSGVLKQRPKTEIRKFIKKMYSDIIKTFKNYKLIIPTGSYLEHLHLVMNQKRIQKEPYHREIMQQFGFKKQDKYYIRYAN